MAKTRKPTDSIPAYCGRIPAGWTYMGIQGTRRGQAKPHYRTAPGVIRTRLTPNHFAAYARMLAKDLDIDEDETVKAAMYIAYGAVVPDSSLECKARGLE